MSLKDAIEGGDVLRVIDILTQDSNEYLDIWSDEGLIDAFVNLLKDRPEYLKIVFNIFENVVEDVVNTDFSYENNLIYDRLLDIEHGSLKKWQRKSKVLEKISQGTNIEMPAGAERFIIHQAIENENSTVLYQLFKLDNSTFLKSAIADLRLYDISTRKLITYFFHPLLIPELIRVYKTKGLNFLGSLREKIITERYIIPSIDIFASLAKEGSKLGLQRSEDEDATFKYLSAILTPVISGSPSVDDPALEDKRFSPYIIKHYIASLLLSDKNINYDYKVDLALTLFGMAITGELYLRVYVKEHPRYNGLLGNTKYFNIEDKWKELRALELSPVNHYSELEYTSKVMQQKADSVAEEWAREVEEGLNAKFAVGGVKFGKYKERFPVSQELKELRERFTELVNMASDVKLVALIEILRRFFDTSASESGNKDILLSVVDELTLSELRELLS